MTKPHCPNGDCSQGLGIEPSWENVEGMCDCLRSCDSLEECIRRIVANGLFGNDIQTYIATKTCTGYTLPISKTFRIEKDVWFSPVSKAAANQLAISNLNQQVASWETTDTDCVTSGNCPNNTVAGTMCVGTSLYQRLCDGNGGYKQGLLLEANNTGCGAVINTWGISTITVGCSNNVGRIQTITFFGTPPAGTKQYSLNGTTWVTTLTDPALELTNNNSQYTLYVKITDVNNAVTTANKVFTSSLCSCSVVQGLPTINAVQSCAVTQGLPILNSVVSGQFTAQPLSLGSKAIGSANIPVVLPEPIATGSYSDVGGRRLEVRNNGIKVYANNTELSIGALFNSTDSLKVDIDSSLSPATNYPLFRYSCLCNLGTYSEPEGVMANLVAQVSGSLSDPKMMLVAGKNYNGNNGVEYIPTSTTQLYDLLVIAKPTDGVIYEDVKFSNLAGIAIGATVHNMAGTQRMVTGYFGYHDSNVPKYARIVNGVVVEIATILVPANVQGFVAFPKKTAPLNAPTDIHNGWLNSANVWNQYIDYVNNQITVRFDVPNNAADGNSFTFTHPSGTFYCRPYFRINRGPKIAGLPKNYTIPAELRGSVVEVVVDIDITSTVTDATFLSNVNTEFNGSYILIVGK